MVSQEQQQQQQRAALLFAALQHSILVIGWFFVLLVILLCACFAYAKPLPFGSCRLLQVAPHAILVQAQISRDLTEVSAIEFTIAPTGEQCITILRATLPKCHPKHWKVIDFRCKPLDAPSVPHAKSGVQS